MEFRQIQPIYTTGATWFGLSLDSLHTDDFDRNALKQCVDMISSCYSATLSSPEDGDSITFKELFYFDLLNFCVYIAMADGAISDKEVEEIKWLLSGNDEAEFEYDRESMEYTANSIYEDRWMDCFPQSFQLLIMAYGGEENPNLESLGEFANFYRQIARYIYSLENNGDLNDNENLKEYIEAFKKYVERVAVIDFSIPGNEDTIEEVCAKWEDLAEAKEAKTQEGIAGVWKPVSGNAFFKGGLSTLVIKEGGTGVMLVKKLFGKKEVPFTWEMSNVLGDSIPVIYIESMKSSVLLTPLDSGRFVAMMKSHNPRLNNRMGVYHRVYNYEMR